MTIADFQNMLHRLDYDQLGLVIRSLWNELFYRGKRRLFCAHFPGLEGHEPLTIVFASGPEWSKKVALLYQAWYARTIHDEMVPPEGEISHVDVEVHLNSLFDLMTPEELTKCQSMLAQRVRPRHVSSSLVKPQGRKKNVKPVRLLEDQADSSTKCSNESGSDDKTAT